MIMTLLKSASREAKNEEQNFCDEITNDVNNELNFLEIRLSHELRCTLTSLTVRCRG